VHVDAFVEDNPTPIDSYDGVLCTVMEPEEPEPDLKVLQYEILGEEQGGSINFNPPALDAEGHYIKGTIVNLKAIVNPGFVFVMWRGEVDDALSTSLTNTVTMSENRTVKAEFAFEDIEEAYSGSISRKEIEHDGQHSSIPVSLLAGTEGLVHIWGRNETSEAQRLGIGWVVQDPDGQVVEQYGTWEAWPYTGAGGEHEFIGGRFDINKTGTYTIIVELRMNENNPVVVDTYDGILCTVVAEEPEEEPPEEEPEEGEFPWVVVGALGLGVAVLIAATRKK